MKTLLIILAVVSGLLMFSTVTCGLWLRYSGKPVGASDLKFHMSIALLTVLVSAVTIILGVANVLNMPA